MPKNTNRATSDGAARQNDHQPTRIGSAVNSQQSLRPQAPTQDDAAAFRHARLARVQKFGVSRRWQKPFFQSGASRFRDSGHDVDIYAHGRNEAPLVFEVKSRKAGAGFTQIERWLGEYDGLALRRNHGEPLIVLPWHIWAALLKKVRP